MKLDSNTITILQNFQTINQSIVINPGSVIRTISPSGSVYGSATVADVFDKQFAIYDLSRFLGILSLHKQSDIEFFDDHMIIDQDNYKVKYTYCSPQLIATPPDKQIVMPDSDIVFDLNSEIFQGIIKRMMIFGFSEIGFIGDGTNLSIVVINTKNQSSDSSSSIVGTTSKRFTCILEAEKLKLIPTDYKVTITPKGLVHFHSAMVDYWIATSTKSQF